MSVTTSGAVAMADGGLPRRRGLRGYLLTAAAPIFVVGLTVGLAKPTWPLWMVWATSAIPTILLLLALVATRPDSRLPGKALVISLLVTMLLAVSSVEWAMPVKVLLLGSAPTANAQSLLSSASDAYCSVEPSVVAQAKPLLSARRACVNPSAQAVWFFGAGVPATGVSGARASRGLLFLGRTPSSAVVPDTCLRHLWGSWYVFQTLLLQCPLGMTGYGSG